MRIARFDAGYGPRLGVVDSLGETIRELTVSDDVRKLMVSGALAPALAEAARGRTHALPGVRLLCPMQAPQAIYGIGFNYRDHAREVGKTPPSEPPVFLRPPSALAGPNEPITPPRGEPSFDYEGELCVVIGAHAHDVDEHAAEAVIFGYAVANDVTIRRLARPETLALAKGVRSSAPIGPWITLAAAIDVADLRVRTWVNDDLRQDSSTREMIWRPAALVAYLSKTFTLAPGDVILTGSPHGSGVGFDPPRWLTAGDRVTVEIGGLGALTNTITSSGFGIKSIEDEP
jgi:2-keto-4-pentenoate hydratase/2-oxohepta-3-ene-1,7-dioic acid hydratase in catechol pathway